MAGYTFLPEPTTSGLKQPHLNGRSKVPAAQRLRLKMERLLLSVALVLFLFLRAGGQPQSVCCVMNDSSDGGHCHIWLCPPRCTVSLDPDACPGRIHLAVDQNISTCNWIWSADGSSFAQLGFGKSSEHSWTGNTSSLFSHAQERIIITCWSFPETVKDKTVVFILSNSRGKEQCGCKFSSRAH